MKKILALLLVLMLALCACGEEKEETPALTLESFEELLHEAEAVYGMISTDAALFGEEEAKAWIPYPNEPFTRMDDSLAMLHEIDLGAQFREETFDTQTLEADGYGVVQFGVRAGDRLLQMDLWLKPDGQSRLVVSEGEQTLYLVADTTTTDLTAVSSFSDMGSNHDAIEGNARVAYYGEERSDVASMMRTWSYWMQNIFTNLMRIQEPVKDAEPVYTVQFEVIGGPMYYADLEQELFCLSDESDKVYSFALLSEDYRNLFASMLRRGLS